MLLSPRLRSQLKSFVKKHAVEGGCKDFHELLTLHMELANTNSELVNWLTISHNLFGGTL